MGTTPSSVLKNVCTLDFHRGNGNFTGSLCFRLDLGAVYISHIPHMSRRI